MIRTMFLIICILVTTGCGDRRNPKLEKYSDAQVQSQVKSCKALASPSRIKALACENYKKECKARKICK